MKQWFIRSWRLLGHFCFELEEGREVTKSEKTQHEITFSYCFFLVNICMPMGWRTEHLRKIYRSALGKSFNPSLLERKNGHSRCLGNHSKLSSLKVWLPMNEGFSHVNLTPGPTHNNPMWKKEQNIYECCVLIGPHGGNIKYLSPFLSEIKKLSRE